MKSSIFLFVLFFASSALFSQPLTLSTIQPSSGDAGERVQLLGQGFNKSAKSYFAWGFDGERGFVLDIRRKSSRTQLGAVLATPHASVKGPVVLWEGRRKPLGHIKLAGGSHGIRKGYVFVPTKVVQGPTFHAKTHATIGGGPGFSGRLIDGEVHLDLAIPTPRTVSTSQKKKEEEDENEDSLAVTEAMISVVCGGESCGPPDGAKSRKQAASSFKIVCLDRGPCRVPLGDLLAEGLEAALGGLGMKARVEGSEVILSHPDSLCGFFLDVTAPTLVEGGFSLRQEVGAIASRRDRRSAASSR